MPLIKEKTNGFYIKERKWKKAIQSSIFDWKWTLIKSKYNLLYNINWIDENWKEIDSKKRLEQILKEAQRNIADLLIWTNFKKPAKDLITIKSISDLEKYLTNNNKFTNLWYADNTIVFNTPDILKDLWIDSLALWWAFADCAWVCWNYNNGEILSISHAWWQWITNWVIEQLIYTYIWKLGKKEFQKVQFDFSPMAWVNYEWDKNFFDKNLWEYTQNLDRKINLLKEEINDIGNKLRIIQRYHIDKPNKLIQDYKTKTNKLYKLQIEINVFKLHKKFAKISEKYNIDFMKDKIVEKTNNPDKVVFFLERLIKRIFLENWTTLKQLTFHQDYTTDLNNSWPSYRIHSLWKKWIITSDMTIKSQNWIIPDARLWVFNTIFNK